ncbi:hypothetical protein LTR81_022756, partial [Elasticomyces elasticus]
SAAREYPQDPVWPNFSALAHGASPNLNISLVVRGLCAGGSGTHLPGNHRATVGEGTQQLLNAKYLVGDPLGYALRAQGAEGT